MCRKEPDAGILYRQGSEIFDQKELVTFLKSRFSKNLKITIPSMKGASVESVEVKVPSKSPEFDEIRQFVEAKRKQGLPGFCNYQIGRYSRSYSPADLRSAELLRLNIVSHINSTGPESGTIYETICEHCNLGRQISDLALDLRHTPRSKDIFETIARTEWLVSAAFEQTYQAARLTGVDFKKVFDRRNPIKGSSEWRQLWITGNVGPLAGVTKLGRDPFTPNQVSWRCPLGHAVATQFLSEIYLCRDTWDGADIGVTTDLFGQGRGVIRPMPLITISQRAFSAFQKAGLKGLCYEVVHLV
jgi:hypothetical protein